MSNVQVYGTDWCEDTQHARQHLESLGVDYDYINVDRDKEASDWVKILSHGKERKPTIEIGEEVLIEPNDQDLDQALRANGVIH
ncbi:MAG: glutaredoxin family protein [Planctomycetes bacterium]|nr:glutaredoxin family protein [Planctomycetota bacterium]